MRDNPNAEVALGLDWVWGHDVESAFTDGS